MATTLNGIKISDLDQNQTALSSDLFVMSHAEGTTQTSNSITFENLVNSTGLRLTNDVEILHDTEFFSVQALEGSDRKLTSMQTDYDTAYSYLYQSGGMTTKISEYGGSTNPYYGTYRGVLLAMQSNTTGKNVNRSLYVYEVQNDAWVSVAWSNCTGCTPDPIAMMLKPNKRYNNNPDTDYLCIDAIWPATLRQCNFSPVFCKKGTRLYFCHVRGFEYVSNVLQPAATGYPAKVVRANYLGYYQVPGTAFSGIGHDWTRVMEFVVK